MICCEVCSHQEIFELQQYKKTLGYYRHPMKHQRRLTSSRQQAMNNLCCIDGCEIHPSGAREYSMLTLRHLHATIGLPLSHFCYNLCMKWLLSCQSWLQQNGRQALQRLSKAHNTDSNQQNMSGAQPRSSPNQFMRRSQAGGADAQGRDMPHA